MGFMDKVKGQADQLASRAQAGTAQVQAKVEQAQAKRAVDQLFHDLGRAYYQELRHDGPHQDVEQALKALDERIAHAGPAAETTEAPSGDFKL